MQGLQIMLDFGLCGRLLTNLPRMSFGWRGDGCLWIGLLRTNEQVRPRDRSSVPESRSFSLVVGVRTLCRDITDLVRPSVTDALETRCLDNMSSRQSQNRRASFRARLIHRTRSGAVFFRFNCRVIVQDGLSFR